tara:strand:- start:500 stop:856 length:357 start_codon:yes stop_codon:yes gene_type:complete
MALGNNTSMGQSRGKNKGTIVRKIREEDGAKDWYLLNGSTVESGDAAACALGSTPNKYYHNAGSAGGYTTGTYIYTEKRDHTRFYLPDGYYKVSHDGSTFKSINIASGRIATTPSTCR